MSWILETNDIYTNQKLYKKIKKNTMFFELGLEQLLHMFITYLQGSYMAINMAVLLLNAKQMNCNIACMTKL